MQRCGTDLQRVPVREPSSHFVRLALQSQVLVSPFIILRITRVGTRVRRLHEPRVMDGRGRGGRRYTSQ